jgi:hypothetical protein
MRRRSVENYLRLDALGLSTKICQSMEYIMQDEMKSYGPASTLFPFKTAYDTFKMGGIQTQGHSEWCQSIINLPTYPQRIRFGFCIQIGSRG